MDEDRDYRAALAMGLRRATLHWIRAGYEVVAGVGALLNEVTEARKVDREPGDASHNDEGPVHIELD
jgi:hypothetical protein